jgi:myosin heavy subunit
VTAKNNFANPSKDAFLEARVVGIGIKEITITLRQSEEEGISYESRQHGVAYEDCQKLTYGPTEVADMVDLEELNEPELLYNLKRRYINDSIFTYCGIVFPI